MNFIFVGKNIIYFFKYGYDNDVLYILWNRVEKNTVISDIRSDIIAIIII